MERALAAMTGLLEQLAGLEGGGGGGGEWVFGSWLRELFVRISVASGHRSCEGF